MALNCKYLQYPADAMGHVVESNKDVFILLASSVLFFYNSLDKTVIFIKQGFVPQNVAWEL